MVRLGSLRLRVFVLMLLALNACSESTMIRTDPPGATVWVNGDKLGTSPIKFKAKSWSVRSTLR